MGEKKENETIRTFLMVFIFIVLVLLFFSDIVFLGKSFSGSDNLFEHVPKRFLISECLKHGVFPLWMPEILFGFPFFASMQDGVLYPLNLVLNFLQPNRQIDFSVVIHCILSGLFMLLYLKRIVSNKKVILLGMITWVFSGMFVYWSNMSWVTSMSYIPLLFYFVESFIITKKYSFILALPPVIALTVLAGEVQTTFYASAILLLYFILRVKWSKIFITKNAFDLTAIALALMFGLLISSVQILPTMELTSQSFRNGAMNAQYILGSEKIAPLNIINVVFPYLFGSRHNNTYAGVGITKSWSMSYLSVYIGVVCIISLLISFFRIIKDKNTLSIFILIVFAFLFSLGGNFFLNAIIVRLPGFSIFRNPVRMMEPCVFLAISLSMISIDSLDIGWSSKNLKRIFWVLLALVACAFVLFLEKDKVLSVFSAKISNLIKDKFISGDMHKYPFEYYHAKFLKAVYFILGHLVFQLLLLASGLFIFILYVDKRIGKNAFLYILLVLTVFDLFINFKSYSSTRGKEYFKKIPDTVKFLKDYDRSLYRILSWKYYDYYVTVFKNGSDIGTDEEYIKSKEILAPDLNIIYGINSYCGYDGLIYKKYLEFDSELDATNRDPLDLSMEDLKKGFNTLNLAGVKYILSPYELKFDSLKLIKQLEDIKIYINKDALPLVNFVPSALHMDNQNDILIKIKTGRIDLSKELLLNVGENFESNHCNSSSVEIKRWDNEIDFSINSVCDGYALITNYYYPGWKAFVDGQKAEIYNADYLFQAVRLNRGRHNVTLKYEPDSLRKGIIITLISLAVYLLLILTLSRFIKANCIKVQR